MSLNAQTLSSLEYPKNKTQKNLELNAGDHGILMQQSSCDDGEIVFKFDGKMKLNYTETQVCISKNGSLLLSEKFSENPLYYISEKGKVTGPVKEGDLRLQAFDCLGNNDDTQSKYVSESEGKYYITVGAKKYGPFASVTNFTITRDESRFVAITLKDGFTGGFDMKDVEEVTKKMENATQAEQIALAMELSAKMEKQITTNTDEATQFVTNIQGINWKKEMGQKFNNTVKNNEICILRDDGSITDLTGKVIFSNTGNEYHDYNNFWISRDNKLQAWFDYGTLRISDGRMIENVFSPIVQTEAGVDFLSYFYYSPDKDAIMKCKIPF
jgi:hypothetical protein